MKSNLVFEKGFGKYELEVMGRVDGHTFSLGIINKSKEGKWYFDPVTSGYTKAELIEIAEKLASLEKADAQTAARKANSSKKD